MGSPSQGVDQHGQARNCPDKWRNGTKSGGHVVSDQAASAWWRLRLPVLGRNRLVRDGVQEIRQRRHPSQTVNGDVVNAENHADSTTLEARQEDHPPERAVAVQRRNHLPGRPVPEVVQIASVDRGCADVGRDVEVGIIEPYRTSFTEPGPADPTPQQRYPACPTLHLISEPGQTQLAAAVEPTWSVERSGQSDLHGAVRAFGPEVEKIADAQPMKVGRYGFQNRTLADHEVPHMVVLRFISTRSPPVLGPLGHLRYDHQWAVGSV